MQQGGLVYLRARYYQGSMGRFLTRDTWEGDQYTPMSYNPWLYSYGNPGFFTDPNGKSALTIFEISQSDPKNWSLEEKRVIDEQVDLSARKYASVINRFRFFFLNHCGLDQNPFPMVTPDEAFLKIHGGPIHFVRSSSARRNAGETKNSHEIWFFDVKNVDDSITYGYVIKKPKVVTHELGHAFGRAVNGEYGESWPENFMREDPNRHKDDYDHWYGFAGDWEIWQFGRDNTPPEVFADMYLGWVYDKWQVLDSHNPDDLGLRRQSFMNRTMNKLLLKYTSDL